MHFDGMPAVNCINYYFGQFAAGDEGNYSQ